MELIVLQMKDTLQGSKFGEWGRIGVPAWVISSQFVALLPQKVCKWVAHKEYCMINGLQAADRVDGILGT